MTKVKEQKIEFDPEDNYGFKTKVAKSWINKQRVLISISKGIKKNEKQVAKNWMHLLCHSKSDVKIEKHEVVEQLRDNCGSKSCENLLYFEQKKDQLYVWLGKYPEGPTVKFHASDYVSAESYKFLGNCLRHSRPVLSFGADFHGAFRALLTKGTQHLRQQILAGRAAGPHAETLAAPVAQAVQFLPRRVHASENGGGVAREAFARRG